MTTPCRNHESIPMSPGSRTRKGTILPPNYDNEWVEWVGWVGWVEWVEGVEWSEWSEWSEWMSGMNEWVNDWVRSEWKKWVNEWVSEWVNEWVNERIIYPTGSGHRRHNSIMFPSWLPQKLSPNATRKTITSQSIKMSIWSWEIRLFITKPGGCSICAKIFMVWFVVLLCSGRP